MGPKKKVEEEVIDEPVAQEPTTGEGTFHFADNSTYVGQWLEVDGVKYRHGKGKLTFLSSSTYKEEYIGDWENDLMTGKT